MLALQNILGGDDVSSTPGILHGSIRKQLGEEWLSPELENEDTRSVVRNFNSRLTSRAGSTH